MFNDNLANKLSMFDFVHLLMLFIFVIIITLTFIFRKKINNIKFEKVFRLSLATILLIFEAAYHIWLIIRNAYSVNMIPFTGFCATTHLFTVIALYANKPKLFRYIIYYALTGSILSLIFVDINFTFPHFRFIHYFLVHFGFLIASLYYFFTSKFTIKLNDVFAASIAILTQALIILIFDLIYDKNWFYLIENPLKSISDGLSLPLYTILWILTITFFTALWYMLLKFVQDKVLLK